MRQAEITAITKLSPSDRYEHFIKQVADRQELWILHDDGWCTGITVDDDKLFYVWPRSEYADLYVNHEWATYRPKEINIFENFLPDLKAQGYIIGVFYVEGSPGVIAPYERLISDLRNELSRYL